MGAQTTLESRGTLEAWRTAVLYQLVHAVATLALPERGNETTINLWTAGSVMFSGSIYGEIALPRRSSHLNVAARRAASPYVRQSSPRCCTAASQLHCSLTAGLFECVTGSSLSGLSGEVCESHSARRGQLARLRYAPGTSCSRHLAGLSLVGVGLLLLT